MYICILSPTPYNVVRSEFHINIGHYNIINFRAKSEYI